MRQGERNPAHKRKYRKQNSPVFSFISHKTLKRAGFILWQFSACFLRRWTGHHFASALKQVATATKPRQSYRNVTESPTRCLYHSLLLNVLHLCHIKTKPSQTNCHVIFFSSNYSNTILHVTPQLWHASNANSTSCGSLWAVIPTVGIRNTFIITAEGLTMLSSFCKRGSKKRVWNCFHGVQTNKAPSADRPPKSAIVRR